MSPPGSGPSVVDILPLSHNDVGMQRSSLQRVEYGFSETTGGKVATDYANTNDQWLGRFLCLHLQLIGGNKEGAN